MTNETETQTLATAARDCDFRIPHAICLIWQLQKYENTKIWNMNSDIYIFGRKSRAFDRQIESAIAFDNCLIASHLFSLFFALVNDRNVSALRIQLVEWMGLCQEINKRFFWVYGVWDARHLSRGRASVRKYLPGLNGSRRTVATVQQVNSGLKFRILGELFLKKLYINKVKANKRVLGLFVKSLMTLTRWVNLRYFSKVFHMERRF